MSTVRIQVRRGTATDWSGVNPILAAGELGVETDTRKIKVGDGSTAWNSLSYIAADVPEIGEISQDAINTALSMGAGLTKTYNDGSNTITINVDSNVVALKSYVDSAVNGLTNSTASTYLENADRGAANGVASLDGTSKVPQAQLPLSTLSTNIVTSGNVQADSLTLSGNLYVNGTTVTLDTATFSTEDPMIQLAKDNVSNMVDLGFVAAHNDGTANHTGLVRDASASKWKLFKGVTTQPGATVDFTQGTFDDLQMRNLEAANVTMTNLDVSGTVTIPANTITNTMMADNSVNTAEISDSAVTEAKLHPLSVTSAKIADSAVTSAKIANQTIVNEDISLTAAIAQTKIAGLGDSLNLLATKEGPTFTGTVVLPATTSIGNLSSTEIGYLDGITSSVQTQITAAGTALNDHAIDTTNIHGIADTAALATKSYADAIGTTATNALALKAPLASPTFTGTVALPAVAAGGDILPTLDNTYSLGSPSKMFKDIYVGPGSLYVNGQKVLQDESGAIVVSADINENLGLRTSGSGSIELDPTGTGSVNIKGPLVVEAGANFSSADGNGIAFSNGIKSDTIVSKTLNTDLSLSGNGTGKVYLNDNAEVNGNLVVGGNLTVSGTTTSVNTETISLADNIIDLNSNFTTGTPTENSGIRVIRGDQNGVQVRWNESTDKWEFTNDGTNYSSVAGIESPTFTGTVTIPSGASIAGFAPIASPTFTGAVTVAASGVVFTDGTQTKAGVPSITNIPTALTEGAQSIEAGRADQFIPLTGAVVITLPATGYSTGQSIDFFQESGTGASFASTNSVVGTPGLKFRATYSVATALKTSSGWLVFGDLSA
jgi:hypothetical protein